ncbi:Lsr2 family DNA-binding protein [Streptomyces sp. NEAU-NA10]|uniref:Lsr2 family DNA-binding protein n=1 Tax=Streptomyces sp. NEAU-NA10 TaxID=3416050 RepID=UPI003CC5B729
MTIAALRALLDEIDEQGGPEAARQWRLHLPDDTESQHAMTQPIPQLPKNDLPPSATPASDAERLPLGKLLAWGDEHLDPEVQDQATRARIAVTGLRKRYAADQELKAITTEAEQLEQRLAELRAREAELAPPKAKTKRKPVEYPAAEVRAWARQNGHDCPPVGRVPKAIVDAWRLATGNAA